MRTTLDLPDDLFREAKIYAAIKGITLKELFTEGLRTALRSSAEAQSLFPPKEGPELGDPSETAGVEPTVLS